MKSTGISPSKVAFTFSVLCLLVGLYFANPLLAQEKFGTLTGVVTDESGAVIPGVSVTVTNKDTDRSLAVVTGFDGMYFARSLEPGRYTVKFSRSGFSTAEYPNIMMLVGQTVKLDNKLKVGGVQTVVEVSEVTPLIDTQSALVAHNVTAEEFDRLPKSR